MIGALYGPLCDLAAIQVATAEIEDRHDFALTVYGRNLRNSTKAVALIPVVTVLGEPAGRTA